MTGLPLFVLSILSLLSGYARVQQGKTADAKPVEAILAAMEKVQSKLVNARVVLDMRMSMPTGAEDAARTAKSLELRSTATIRMLRKKEGYYARMDVDMQTPRGFFQVKSLRTPEGMWIHQASRMAGESWLKIDKKLMVRLKRAAELLGSSGAMQQAGASDPAAFLGTGLLKGLSRSYDMTLGRSVVVNEVDCHRIVLKLQKTGAMPLSMRGERPSDIHVFIGKKDLIMRKMVQMRGERTVFELELLTLNLSANVNENNIIIHPPKGARFRDIRDDPIASIWIRDILQKLRQAERDIEAKKAAKQTGSAKNAEDSSKKSDKKFDKKN